MSKYEQLKKRNPKDFKRLVGVKEETFNAMIEVFKAYDSERKNRLGIGGRKSLCPEDKVLLMLSYYRELYYTKLYGVYCLIVFRTQEIIV